MKITKKIIKLLNIYYLIYKYTYNATNKIYIGITKDPVRRFRDHKSRFGNKKRSSLLNRAILSHGIENFTIEIIDGHKDIDIAKNQETGWIGQYRDSGYELYNISRGGVYVSEEVSLRKMSALVGTKKSKEFCEFMSKLHKNKIVSEETREKLRIANTGKKLSKEHKEKLRIIMTGKKMNLSEESLAKISATHKGKIIPEEMKKHLSEINSGEKHPKSKLTNNQALEIIKLHSEGELNQRQIGELFGVKPNTVNQIVNNKRWTHIK